MAYSFSLIKTNGDLDKVLMQLRLHKLPLTLEVINTIRVAIQTQHLDEKLHKTLEREFSGQWKEIQKKHKLAEWPRNQIGKVLESIQPTIHVSMPMRVEGHGMHERGKHSKQKGSQKSMATKRKQNQKSAKKHIASTKKIMSGKYVNWTFPINLNLPPVIETFEEMDVILDDLKKFPKRITYNLTHDIAARIRNQKVFDYYKDELREIREKNEFEEEKRLRKRNLQGSVMKPKQDSFVITRASENSLYETFEYGLSDW